MNTVNFSFLDYFFFGIVFVVSIVIGLYFALKTKKQQSVDEYIFGGKNLGVVPVAFSLLATCITGSATIGQSMEVYAYGLHNFVYILMIPVWGSLTAFVFLPVFYDLQLMSSFTYLELRFDRSVKHIASALYVITGLFIIPMTIYVPAISLQEVSGINLYVICIVSGGLCIWYTAIGGFRAVVWTDVFQFLLLFFSVLVIFIVGLKSVGGFQNTWDALDRGGRLDIIRTDFNLETRGTIWAYFFSVIFTMLFNMCLTQSSIQRFLSLSSYRKAKQAVLIQTFFCAVILILQFVIGAVIYATYEDCDPIKAGIVKKIDQLFPYFVQEKASLFPGFNGIFIAGTFSAGLSTTSTLLNTMSGTIYTDFLSDRFGNSSGRTVDRIMKINVAIIGVIGIALIFLIERLGTIFVITVICFTFSTVGVFGLFCNGMIFKNINSKGAKCGVIVSMIVVGILIAGSLNKKPDPVLLLRTDGCDFLNTTSLINPSWSNSTETKLNPNNEDLLWIFRINFQFFCIIGLIINFVVGSIVSFLTGGNTVEDQRLLLKFLRKDIPKETLLSQKTNVLHSEF
ncbi:sodium-coupled monocarboxylate transporter 2-like [Lutzomyia longipalpis]|uniref:sodium-coupled monocarboxylate transporter 2-like n=1 Tax=Lutzomyia longipalpis TaxID=7200 RepID=UPI00248385FE|nr:sodium-coupled monocarboxylate transporter 2-like [Lutzomyia longipalpis]